MKCRARLIKTLSLILGLALVVGCVPRQYSQEDLASRGAKDVQGVVTKQSRGSFVLKDDFGGEQIYRTGELTQYIPVDYRSLEGDQVRVVFEEVWERSGRLKLAVLQLELVELAEENQPLASPVTGEIVAVDRGSAKFVKSILLKIADMEEALPIYVSPQAIIQLDGETRSAEEFAFENLVGRKVSVSAEREPIFRGNAYIYATKHIVAP